MTIEIEDPEVEALIQQRMATGRYDSVETALRFVLTSAPSSPPSVEPEHTWADVIAAAQAFGGFELDIKRDYTHNPNREIDFS